VSFENIHRSEVEDFRTELRRHGRSVEEFDVSATPQSLADQSGAIRSIHGEVTIRNRKSGEQRTYDTGHATNWVARFGEDLKAGIL
jgi:hypothetical protein